MMNRNVMITTEWDNICEVKNEFWFNAEMSKCKLVEKVQEKTNKYEKSVNYTRQVTTVGKVKD